MYQIRPLYLVRVPGLLRILCFVFILCIVLNCVELLEEYGFYVFINKKGGVV